MGAKQFARALAVIGTLAGPYVWALGLGDIRLNSALNAPLDAEIDLLNASAEELAGLKANLASRETFARYGLEFPNFLSSVTFTIAKAAGGRDVLKVRSRETITEPFVTLLVDANWGRGRLVREYTVLLDPPVFTPNAPSAVEVAQPTTGDVRSGAIERSAEPLPTQAAPAAAPAAPMAAPAATPAATGDSYRVRSGDTLSAIAARLSSAPNRDQMMVALYRANPGAFDGSMNDLRAGAILRVPAPAEVTAIGPTEALTEMRRQYAAWRERSAQAAARGRLRLVAPGEGPAPGAAATPASPATAPSAEAAALRERLGRLETELAESRRLVELRNTELADLQRRLAALQAGTAAPGAVTAPAPAAPTPAAEPAPAPAEPAAAAPAAPDAAVEPAAEPTPAPSPEAPVPAVAPPAEEPSFFASIVDAFKSYWYVLAALLVGFLGFIGFRKWQESRVARADDSLNASLEGSTIIREHEMTMPPPPLTETSRMRRPNISQPDERGMLVEESAEREKQPAAKKAAVAAAATASTDVRPVERTFSGETAINLDQGDALAEADFHMAYGLYDQAADLVRNAITREPERRDLKLKLVEVFFVWGNKDEFLKAARGLRSATGAESSGDWDKVVIMGKQIAPEDPMFSGATAGAGAVAEGVDLDLAGGEQRIDFDFVGTGAGGDFSSTTPPGSQTGKSGLDMEFGTQTAERLSVPEVGDGVGADNTMTARAAHGGTTQQMMPNFAGDASMPTLTEADLTDMNLGEAPTIEQPSLRAGSPTIRQKMDAAMRQVSGDQTAEVALDDLGLELGGTAKFGALASDDVPFDSPTTVAGLDEATRRQMQQAAGESAVTGRWKLDLDAPDTSATAAMRAVDPTVELGVDASSTAQMPIPSGGLDFDLEKADATVNADFNLDRSGIDRTGVDRTGVDRTGIDRTSIDSTSIEGTGVDRTSVDLQRPDDTGIGEQMTLPPLEPVTISEVGTKLDLARAYMDMGDPDGARNILKEVLQEGSVGQKQEAQRLIDSLPG